jgi:membrane protease YdiL (CAAX protease family)
MSASSGELRQGTSRIPLLIIVWGITLLVSGLGEFIFRVTSSSTPPWLFWAKEIILLVVLGISFFVSLLKPLRKYQERFGQMAWLVGTASIRILVVVISFIMMGALLLMGLHRKDFYFTKGKLDAPADGVRWLGLKPGTPWTKFAPLFTLIVFLVLLVFLVFTTKVPLRLAATSLLWLPMFVFIAGINSFGEELGIRAPMLATIHPVIGKNQAMLLTAVYFGLLHLDSWPAGAIWALETGFLAWILAKSMLETRGSLWAWLIHLIVDIPVYAFMAMQSLK